MLNKVIQAAVYNLINTISEEESMNIEYSIEAAIEQLEFELRQERLIQDHMNNRKYYL